MIDFLLENANPSIKRRVKSEILGNITPEEERIYQNQILNETNIKTAFASQLENGWFGLGFHGTNKDAGQFENMETCTKYLAEKAVDKDMPELKRAMDAFVKIPLDDICYRTKGKYYDEFRYAANGQNLIRCLIRDAPLALRFAGLPTLFGGRWTLEAVKQCGGDPPAFTCRFLIGVTAMAGDI